MSSDTDPDSWAIDRTTPMSTGNRARMLVDGADYFAAVLDELATLKADDFFWLACWEMADVDLAGAGDPADNLIARLQAAADADVGVRVLFGGGYPGATRAHQRIIDDDLTPWGIDGFVQSHPYGLAGSHHDKVIVIGRWNGSDHEVTAYVGGIDPTPARVGVVGHTSGSPWHDAAVKLHGEVANHVAAYFEDRWIVSFPATSRLRFVSPPAPLLSVDGEFSVAGELLHTFYPGYLDGPKETILESLMAAISNAERYIYIETPYLTCKHLGAALLAAVSKPEAPKLVMVVWAEPDLPGIGGQDTASYLEAENTFLFEIRAANNTATFAELKTPASLGSMTILTHAKLAIIDDRYVFIGSANLNARSMHVDTETAVALIGQDLQVDEEGRTVSSFAVDLRRRLWAEHLGAGLTEPETLVDGLARWEGISDETEPGMTARLRQPSTLGTSGGWWSSVWWRNIIDPGDS